MYTVLLRVHPCNLYMYGVPETSCYSNGQLIVLPLIDSSMSRVLQQNVEKFMYMIYAYTYMEHSERKALFNLGPQVFPPAKCEEIGPYSTCVLE